MILDESLSDLARQKASRVPIFAMLPSMLAGATAAGVALGWDF